MRALIIDDSRAMRIIIKGILRDLGVESIQAGTGREALDQLEAGEKVDFCMVDWNMPEMNGFEFVVAVKANSTLCSIPMMMVTTETEMSQVVKALDAGANEYVMKPFTKDVIAEKLELLGLMVS